MSAETEEQLIERAATEVDTTLLEWFAGLSMIERLRVTSRSAALLVQWARTSRGNPDAL